MTALLKLKRCQAACFLLSKIDFGAEGVYLPHWNRTRFEGTVKDKVVMQAQEEKLNTMLHELPKKMQQNLLRVKLIWISWVAYVRTGTAEEVLSGKVPGIQEEICWADGWTVYLETSKIHCEICHGLFHVNIKGSSIVYFELELSRYLPFLLLGQCHWSWSAISGNSSANEVVSCRRRSLIICLEKSLEKSSHLQLPRTLFASNHQEDIE